MSLPLNNVLFLRNGTQISPTSKVVHLSENLNGKFNSSVLHIHMTFLGSAIKKEKNKNYSKIAEQSS